MQHANSLNQSDDVQLRLGLLNVLESGILDSIGCPRCHQPTVSVSFTHPSHDEFRTWFICKNCSFSMRTQNSEQPKHFSSDRVDERLEHYDLDILRKSRLD